MNPLEICEETPLRGVPNDKTLLSVPSNVGDFPHENTGLYVAVEDFLEIGLELTELVSVLGLCSGDSGD